MLFWTKISLRIRFVYGLLVLIGFIFALLFLSGRLERKRRLHSILLDYLSFDGTWKEGAPD